MDETALRKAEQASEILRRYRNAIRASVWLAQMKRIRYSTLLHIQVSVAYGGSTQEGEAANLYTKEANDGALHSLVLATMQKLVDADIEAGERLLLNGLETK